MPERKQYHDYLSLYDKGEAIGHNNALSEVARLNAAPVQQVSPARPELAVWYGSMPESNGKSNFTALLYRKGESLMGGVTITLDRSEYPDRVRYEADRVRYLIGELEDEPFIPDYDADKHSGYVRPVAPAADVGLVEALNAHIETLQAQLDDDAVPSIHWGDTYNAISGMREAARLLSALAAHSAKGN